jgi:hypothetical protein
MSGFSPREHDAATSWRWMSDEAAWTIVNTTGWPVVATLALESWTFSHARTMDVWLDQHLVQTLVVAPARRTHALGPFTITAGTHELRFRSIERPVVAADILGNADPRALSFAIGAWSWTVQGRP